MAVGAEHSPVPAHHSPPGSGRAVALVGLISLLLGLPMLRFPLGRDQGEYGYTALAAMRGQVVYRDVF